MSLFPSNNEIPSPQEKAKAVYYALMSQENAIIQDILAAAPDEFKHSKDYKDFLINEIGVLLCLLSTREGHVCCFTDREKSEIFTATLFSLFKHHLQISWDVFQLYIQFSEKLEEPDKICTQIFAGRIVAFLHNDNEVFTNKGKLLIYAWYPEALIYAEYYIRIFEAICRILNRYAGKSANTGEILETAKNLDEILK